MFIKSIDITNYKLFKETFSVDFNVPDSATPGSGLTVFCGENGNGKSTILEAIGLASQDYRAENFAIEYINDLKHDVDINLHTTPYQVTTVLPSGKKFNAIGFTFKANKRKRTSGELYGNLIVSGRKIIPETEQKDYELRCEGTTPWGHPRYEQPFLLFLDRNRIYQARKGSTTATNFDYLLERLSLDNEKSLSDCKCELEPNHPLKKTFDKFEEKFSIPLYLYNRNPLNSMENAFVASNIDDSVIKLKSLGSGYEMFFSILWAIYRSLSDKKDLIILLDEPELHLHPNLQKELISLLSTLSSKVQVIISTHSPLFVKQLKNDNTKFHILHRNNTEVSLQELKEQKIKGYLSLNEVNFMAFGLYTEEYFNELYETLYRKVKEEDNSIDSPYNFDRKFFVEQNSLVAYKPYRADNNSKKVSYITFVRNVIHHRIDYTKAGLEYTDDEFKRAIDTMRSYL